MRETTGGGSACGWQCRCGRCVGVLGSVEECSATCCVGWLLLAGWLVPSDQPGLSSVKREADLRLTVYQAEAITQHNKLHRVQTFNDSFFLTLCCLCLCRPVHYIVPTFAYPDRQWPPQPLTRDGAVSNIRMARSRGNKANYHRHPSAPSNTNCGRSTLQRSWVTAATAGTAPLSLQV